MKWLSRVFKSAKATDSELSELAAAVASETADALANPRPWAPWAPPRSASVMAEASKGSFLEPLEQFAKANAEFVSVGVRLELEDAGWRMHEVHSFFGKLAIALIEAGIDVDRARVLIAVAREQTLADIAAGKKVRRTKNSFSEHMRGRDRKQWDFSAFASGGSPEELRLFANLEAYLSETEYVVGCVHALELDQRRAIAAMLHDLVIESAGEPAAASILWTIHMTMRENGDVLHAAPWMANLLLGASEVVQPAAPWQGSSEAFWRLQWGGKKALLPHMRLAPSDLVILQQGWMEHFLIENGQRPWPAAVVYTEVFRTQRAGQRLSPEGIAALNADLQARCLGKVSANTK